MTLAEASMGRKLLAEFVGSALLVVAAISPTILAYDWIQTETMLAVLSDALAVGFALIALIEMLGPVSGCHLNPAVTLSMILSKKFDIKTGVAYIAVQIPGGILGTICSHLMYYPTRPLLIISTVERCGAGGCYFAEFLGTFFLITTIYGCTKHNSKFTSLVIGLLVGGLLLTTSSTMFANPQVTIARMFTYAIAGIEPSDAIFFIFAQVLGSLAATGFSLYLFSPLYERGQLHQKR